MVVDLSDQSSLSSKGAASSVSKLMGINDLRTIDQKLPILTTEILKSRRC